MADWEEKISGGGVGQVNRHKDDRQGQVLARADNHLGQRGVLR